MGLRDKLYTCLHGHATVNSETIDRAFRARGEHRLKLRTYEEGRRRCGSASCETHLIAISLEDVRSGSDGAGRLPELLVCAGGMEKPRE